MAERRGFDFEVRPGRRRAQPLRREESAMRILVLGDFSGRRGAGDYRDLASRKPAAIDVDNFERVNTRIAPRLELPG